MRNHLTLVGAIIALLLFYSCSDDVVNGVFVQEKQNTEREKSVLTVTLKNLEISEGLVAGILNQSIFDEYGGVSDVSRSDFLEQISVNTSKVVFEDLTPYYKSTVYVNIFKVDGETFTPITNRANQLEYFVAFGNVEKTIDCGISDLESIKQTAINVSVPIDYIGKELYLVLKENQELFINSIQAGGDIDEGLFIKKCILEQTNAKFLIDTPLSAKNYILFLLKPEDGILYLKHELQEINYDVTEVAFEFKKETKKQIIISAIRGDEPLNNHEVYLIETEKWPLVEDIVKNQHGHPESDMYVEKKTILNGSALFELFCTEGTKDYVVYIPKWNTEYYDSYQKLEVTVNSTQESYELKFDFPYVPPTGGGAITKTVDFEVTVSDLEGYSFGWAGAYVYVLNDSEKLKDAIYSIGYSDFEGLYKSDISVTNVSELPLAFSVKSVEISTDKEVAIFIYPVLQGFSQMLSIKREPGANITNGFKVSLTKDNLENIPY